MFNLVSHIITELILSQDFDRQNSILNGLITVLKIELIQNIFTAGGILMSISHVALWTKDLENSKNFFVTFFNGHAGEKYINVKTNFQSYFLTFESGPSLEIMSIPNISHETGQNEQFTGFSHIAFSVGSMEAVNSLIENLRSNNCKVIVEPHYTGDGYYEGCILDPDNNRIEITI